jgi:hypothetical protein
VPACERTAPVATINGSGRGSGHQGFGHQKTASAAKKGSYPARIERWAGECPPRGWRGGEVCRGNMGARLNLLRNRDPPVVEMGDQWHLPPHSDPGAGRCNGDGTVIRKQPFAYKQGFILSIWFLSPSDQAS